MSEAPSPGAKRCPRCGTRLRGAGAVEGLCSGCLLGLGLMEGEEEDTPPRLAATPSSRGGRDTGPRLSSAPDAPAHRPLHPLGAGLVAPLWAMPVELLRQAARRLRDTALGLGTVVAVAIVLNNLMEAFGWYHFAHAALKHVVAGGVIAVSALVAWVAHHRQLAPRRLLALSLGYEVVVAMAISIGDHLEPIPNDVPLANLSWLCVWIVLFPLVVTAPPWWAFLASFASASMWPLAHLVSVAVGNPVAPARLLLLNAAEGYMAVALAMLTTFLMRRLQELGCYHLERRLDHGGMGEIWRARHHLLARPVAVKLIRPELLGVRTPAETAGLVGRFRREAEATAALHSSHTVALHDFGMTPEGVFYYVMELLDGLDLDTLVRRFGPVPPERAIHLLLQACESLADAHSAGLIHRDVKPANLVTCRWGLKYDFLKVLDFGLVKATWSMGEDDRLTSDGVIAGTPAYIAPEVALGGRILDARVDLYGLGCVAYWLLTGERVFTGATPMEVVLNHVRTPPVPPSERIGRPLPEPLEELVLSCLAKEARDRPPSAEWLGDRLAECRIEAAWTPGRAREWWERNVASGSRPPAAPEPTNPMRASTSTATRHPDDGS
jgi:serine/threonine protein kinase